MQFQNDVLNSQNGLAKYEDVNWQFHSFYHHHGKKIHIKSKTDYTTIYMILKVSNWFECFELDDSIVNLSFEGDLLVDD